MITKVTDRHPDTYEAIQFTGANAQEILEWGNAEIPYQFFMRGEELWRIGREADEHVRPGE